ncbi:uncharacterized protein LOC130896456 [Diorhabda carinulata]|uniref:uncharacterized protein LOC130896456 n=1 Tax=Diorhabda carinulata TaxID=1163345 RepID=UPI0025A2F83C|nr:uncharacterized protein LOC130896456 [Diorhabda carinulata]XP_057660578.1 uncharacterized protein LOC130896456 [Diorhabda carinulata]XP_057660579.1 uncharacterized protein LOC130896456 [Diorhabda carinulata]
MWSSVAPDNVKSPAPSARSKHSSTLIGEYVYILGGRNGNLPTKDFWKYNLVTGKWYQIKPSGDKLPCLQEHTAVAYKDCLYVFGGEVGFSAGTETPLWIYDIKLNCWKKKKTKKGVVTPKGRRGHTALVTNGSMLIYGGYQDLRGSSNELWAYHFDTESWHLISTTGKGSSECPPPRHKHSAVLQGDAMWIYGGMTDLQERSDLWKWDIPSRTWHCVKSKINPGPLHSHAACKLPSAHMLIFGGERNGQANNDLWKFSFALESWEKVTINGAKPQPRSESIAIIISELLLNGSLATSLDSKCLRIRRRTCTSADRGSRHSSYLPNNKVAPCEKTYIFQPTQMNYNDGSDLAQQFSETNRSSRGFLQEIQKLSQLNIPRMSNKCSYTVLTGCAGDSTESLLRQHASPQAEVEVIDTDMADVASPRRGSMKKSKSAYVIKKKFSTDNSPSDEIELREINPKKRVEFDSTAIKIPREPISVPNFSVLSLPTPVLTPVEAAKLVYLDSEDENELLGKNKSNNEKKNNVQVHLNNEKNIYENFLPIKKGESYSSHIGYADNPLYQDMIKSLEEKSRENVSSTSDYASIETVNRLSSASSYSVKTGTPQEENQKNTDRDRNGPFGFCNPNYMGPEIKSLMNDKVERKSIVKLISTEENFSNSEDENGLEMQNYESTITRNTKVVYRHSSRKRPPKSLSMDSTYRSKSNDKCRALSAGRVETKIDRIVSNKHDESGSDPALKVYLYIFGGKEQGQVTVFQRPISIWRLKLF